MPLHAKVGVDERGDDVATLMTATWKPTRQAVLSRRVLTEFKFRQYLFAARARLLIKLSRPVEVSTHFCTCWKAFRKCVVLAELNFERTSTGQKEELAPVSLQV